MRQHLRKEEMQHHEGCKRADRLGFSILKSRRTVGFWESSDTRVNYCCRHVTTVCPPPARRGRLEHSASIIDSRISKEEE